MLNIDQVIIQPVVNKVRTKDPAAKHELVDIHLPIAKIIARQFSRARINQRNDIRASAYLGLVDAVDKVSEGHGKDGYITPYISIYIRRYIIKFLISDHLIPVDCSDGAKQLPIVFSVDPNIPLACREESESLEAMDAMLVCTALKLTRIEKNVLDLRLNGQTLEAIATGFGHKKNWAWQIMNKIAEKYINCCRKYPSMLKPRKVHNNVEA